MRFKHLKRCAVAGGCALTLTATLAVAAPGDTVYGGTTDEGTKVRLVVATAGNATVFKIARTQADCQQGTLATEAATFKGFDVSDPGQFSDKRKHTIKDGRYVLKDTFMTAGTASADGTSWTGTYEKRTRVLKNGSRIDVCVLSTTWEAS
jgi:hypothetical protein